MRIAVAQLVVEPTRRTLTFQRALRAIDEASEKDPAPDVVVLPAFCDVPSVIGGNLEILERRAGPTVAGCGERARQWGVFVVLGIAELGTEKPYATGVLLDNDGDLCLAHRQRVFRTLDWPVAGNRRGADAPRVRSDQGCSRFAAGESVLVADVLLGRIAVLTGDDILDAEAWAAAAEAGAVVVLGTACWVAGDHGRLPDAAGLRKQVSGHAKRHRLGCAVADVTTGSADSGLRCPGSSMIVDADGEVLAAAEPWKGSMLWGDLSASPCAGGPPAGGGRGSDIETEVRS